MLKNYSKITLAGCFLLARLIFFTLGEKAEKILKKLLFFFMILI